VVVEREQFALVRDGAVVDSVTGGASAHALSTKVASSTVTTFMSAAAAQAVLP
jgi:hypothetical protein